MYSSSNEQSTANLSELAVFRQLPGYVGCMDAENKFNHFVNDQCAYIIGYDDKDEVYGRRIDEMRCKAAECSDIFIEQNRQVFENKQSLKAIDIHPYRNDELKILLAHKIPLLDNQNKVTAVIWYATEIIQQNLLTILRLLTNTDRHYRPNKNANQRIYNISDSLKKSSLTQRESECFFYLARGKTANQIAAIFSISKRTVEKHIANIKIKLDCNTKSDLIDKAIDSNFIDYIPESVLTHASINLSVII